MAETKLKIAVFIDFDNIEIGVKTTLGSHFDAGAVLEAIKERGDVVTKIAYGDWTRAGDYSRSLTQHAIHMVQRNLTPGGDKNGADINLALDALEMAFTHSHINTFVIVSGDSDFMALVEKLKQYDRKVLVVGGRAFTSQILQKNCHEFIAYENLVGRRAGPRGRPQQDTPLTGAVTLVRRALKVLTDREVSPQLGVLKSTLLQLDPTFSEREYGASTFRDLVQRLDRAGYVTLKGTDRNLYVELREGTDGAPVARDPEPVAAIAGAPEPMPERVTESAPDEPPPAPVASRREEPIEPDSQLAILPAPLLASEPDLDELDAAAYAAAHGMPPPGRARRDGREGRDGRDNRAARDGRDGRDRDGRNRDGGRGQGAQAARQGGAQGGTPPPVADPALQADGYRAMERVFLKPGAVTRWPLYLRQAKAVLRAGDEGFDERKYGFAGLVEALRFGQREGLFRLDRDRQGVLRVYPGQLLQRAEGGGAIAGGGRRAGVPRADHGRGRRAGHAGRRAAGRRRADRRHAGCGVERRGRVAGASRQGGEASRRRREEARRGQEGRPQGPRRESPGPGCPQASRQEGRLVRRFRVVLEVLPKDHREHHRERRREVYRVGSRSTTVASSYFTVTGADIVTGVTCRRSSSL